MNKDDYYMNIALKEAKKAYKKAEVPVGALIVIDNKIIAKAHNLRENKNNIINHAELIAIKKASKKKKNWRLDNSVMYVTLFPCPMCASAIMQSRIKKIVVGAPTKDLKNKEIVHMIFDGNTINPSIEIKENVLKTECMQILGSFFKERRN